MNRPNNNARAALWMLGALVSFATMAVSARELSDAHTPFQITLFRTTVSLLIVLAFAATTQRWRELKTRRPAFHLLRNCVHFGGQVGWFYGIAVIPLAEAIAYEFTSPIWTAILAILFLGERLSRVRVLATALGFAGILVILRPGISTIEIASFAVIGAAMCYAATYVMTRAMTPTETPLAIVFWMNLIQAPLGLATSLHNWVAPSLEAAPTIAAVGVAGLTAHLCLAKALSHAEATVVVPMDFLRLPLLALIGYLFYREPLDPFVAVGAIMIVASAYANVRAR